MRNFWTIWNREFGACFLSPVAYVVLVVFLAASGTTFLWGVVRAPADGSLQPLVSLLVGSVAVWMTLLITVVSMRLFAEEKRSGTLETLLTAPVSDAAVVLGKYAGAMTFVSLVLAAAVSQVFILLRLSPGIDLADLDVGALAGGFLILVLVAAFCTAVGLLISLLTRNQIVAAICCFVGIWVVLLCGGMVSSLPLASPALVQLVSVEAHIDDFSRGLVDSRPIVLYVSATWLVLFATVRALECRRWH